MRSPRLLTRAAAVGLGRAQRRTAWHSSVARGGSQAKKNATGQGCVKSTCVEEDKEDFEDDVRAGPARQNRGTKRGSPLNSPFSTPVRRRKSSGTRLPTTVRSERSKRP